jgi:hypothetical protein
MGALLLLTGLTVSSCLEPPDYPDTPTIGFQSITSKRITDNTGTYDQVTITVSFRDGNGDLGLTNEDKVPGSPWAERNPDGSFNPYYNNYYLTPYPPLATDGREAPLRGDLSFSYNFYVGSPFRSGQVVRFDVSILDRALNQSNTVTTDPITIP